MRLEDLSPEYLFDGPGPVPRSSRRLPLPLDSEPGPPDFAATVRAPEWEQWLCDWPWIEGDPRADAGYLDGEPAWWSRAKLARKVERGSRLYICCRGRLRLWVALRPIGKFGETVQEGRDERGLWIPLCIDGSPPGGGPWWQPVTLDADMPGFRGLRRRWWPREAEIPCPDWSEAAEGTGERGGGA